MGHHQGKITVDLSLVWSGVLILVNSDQARLMTRLKFLPLTLGYFAFKQNLRMWHENRFSQLLNVHYDYASEPNTSH